MIKWFKKIFERIFSSKILMLEEQKNIEVVRENKSDFRMHLKQQADPEQDDGSGYRIINKLRLEDMV